MSIFDEMTNSAMTLSLKMSGKPIPDHLLRYAASQGVCCYLSRKLTMAIVLRTVRPQVRRRFDHLHESRDTSEVAGFMVGVRKASVHTDIKMDHFDLEFIPGKEDRIKFSIYDEEASGQLQLHIEKEARFLHWNFGDYHNKDYIIDFKVNLRKISSWVSISRTLEGMPIINMQLDLEDFNLKRDTSYHIHNTDALTAVMDLADRIWMPIVEKEIRRSLVGSLTHEINCAIRDEINKVYKTSITIAEDLNFRLDMRYEHFSVSERFLRVLINGHVENQACHDAGDTSMQRLVHTCGDLLDISSDIDEGKIHLQASDCAVYSLLQAYFNQDRRRSIDIDSGMIKSVDIISKREYRFDARIVRSDRDGSPVKDYAVCIEVQVLATVKQKYLPDVVLGATLGLMVTDINFEGPKEDGKMYLKFKVHDIAVQQVFNSKMEPLTSSGTKGMVDLLKKKASEMNYDSSVPVDSIPVEDYCKLQPVSLACYRNFFLFTASVEF